MKIMFTAPEIGISGGTKAIFEFANHLHERGHDVSVVYPLIPMGLRMNWYNLAKLIRKAPSMATKLKRSTRLEWFDIKAKLIRVPTLAERFVPDADIVVATWWQTAYYVSNYKKNKGEKFYLIQHYEIWGGPEEKVNSTYKLGLRNIVNSTWLRNILQDKLNAPVEALILHAPDWDHFYPEKVERQEDDIRILMPYRKEKWKGTEDGIRAFEIAREKCPNIRLVMFGPISGKSIPKYAEFYERPCSSKLRKIYNSCDIFLFPSHHEGFGMPPMEAMVCKLAVVTTNVGAILEYAVSDETALVSPPQSPEPLGENLIRLIEGEEFRKQIAEAGHNHIKRFTWDKATDELEEVFSKALDERKE